MISYYRIDLEKWEKEWYYDYRVSEAFPTVDKNKIYKCVSLLESNSPDTVLRVIINEDEDDCVYIPSRFMIPIEDFRNNTINQILEEDEDI